MPSEQKSELKKGLGLTHIFCIASGAMISSGLFVLPGLAYAKTGSSVVLAYLMAGVLAVPGMLSISEMATAMPKAGADAYGVIRSMGPGVGTVAGVLSWFALAMKSAFALIGFAILTTTMGELGVPIELVAGLACVAFVTINYLGVREAGRLQLGLAVFLFALMAGFLLLGLSKVQVQRFAPFTPHGTAALFSVTGYVFISYGGLLKIASMAEEIRNPSRNIPLGMIVSLLVVTIVFTLMVFVTTGVMEGQELAGSRTPISDAARVFLGDYGAVALGMAACLAFLSTANAGIMTAARSLVPLSRDKLLPRIFSRTHPRYGTPFVALLLTGVFVLGTIFLQLEILVEAASVVLILANILACLSVIILRESGVQNYRPEFRTPLYPWLQAAGLVGFGLVLLEMGLEAYIITTLVALIGFSTYWFYGRKRVRRESALLHLIERITAQELVTGTLETELKGVLLERDEVELDRFDHIVEDCPVLDIEEPIERDEFFDRVGERLDPRMDEMDADEIAAALKEREEHGSTALNTELAVPHVVIEGEETFELLLARCRKGVHFSEEAPDVRAVFVLLGTRDERNFYLYALSAIAQVAGDPEFTERWRQARDAQNLKDLVVLGERTRRNGTIAQEDS